jgi:MoxR-like ATPase
LLAPKLDDSRPLAAKLLEALATVLRGKREQLELVVTTVAAGGHLLLEDIPGTGKTTLAKAIAVATGGVFKRVQFTPDLLPTDIVGASIYQPADGTFRFKPGPVFANVLISDEINRASPRTQSALLEALSEGQVTVDGETHALAPPFVCIATQNPVEFHGTYPLPEAQLDRFAVQLSLGYPPESEERTLLESHARASPLSALAPVTTPDTLVALQRQVDSVAMEASVSDYLFRLVHATRSHASIRLGVSTRGALVFAKMGRARALLRGRDYVLPDDLKSLAPAVLAHRLVLDTRAKYAGADKQALVRELLEKTPLPR